MTTLIVINNQELFSLQLAATVDLFVTIVKLAGGEVPTDRPLDGIDMSPILFQQQEVPP